MSSGACAADRSSQRHRRRASPPREPPTSRAHDTPTGAPSQRRSRRSDWRGWPCWRRRSGRRCRLRRTRRAARGTCCRRRSAVRFSARPRLRVHARQRQLERHAERRAAADDVGLARCPRTARRSAAGARGRATARAAIAARNSGVASGNGLCASVPMHEPVDAARPRSRPPALPSRTTLRPGQIHVFVRRVIRRAAVPRSPSASAA